MANRLERERNQDAWIRRESDEEKHKLQRMAVVRLREAPQNARVVKATVSLAFARGPLGTQSRGSVCRPGPRLSGQVCAETRACVEHLPDIPPLVQFSGAVVAGQEGG